MSVRGIAKTITRRSLEAARVENLPKRGARAKHYGNVKHIRLVELGC
jgi:hypothetical protein